MLIKGAATTYMLVDQQHTNIFPLLREILKGLFDCCRFGLRINHKEVTLGFWWFRDMLDTRVVNTILFM